MPTYSISDVGSSFVSRETEHTRTRYCPPPAKRNHSGRYKEVTQQQPDLRLVKVVAIVAVVAILAISCIYSINFALLFATAGAKVLAWGPLFGFGVGFGVSALAAPFIAVAVDLFKEGRSFQRDMMKTVGYITLMLLSTVSLAALLFWKFCQWSYEITCFPPQGKTQKRILPH